jgi:hypothetical protein
MIIHMIYGIACGLYFDKLWKTLLAAGIGSIILSQLGV